MTAVRAPAPGGPPRGQGRAQLRPVSPRPPRRSRLVSAGQVLGVGLLCFALWLVFDARALYTSAESSPLGVRRSVALTILRPIARASSALSLDRLVDAANEILGRGAPASVAPVHPTTRPTTRPNHVLVTPTTVPTPAAKKGPLPLVSPSAAHPLTVLDVGDSIGEDLGFGLADFVGENRYVHLDEDAVESTGLADTAYYDWPAKLESELRADHPTLVVVMMGGNDATSFPVGNKVAVFGTPFWRAAYGARVAAMMSEATSANAQVIWVGMPIMQSASLSAAMAQIDAVDEHEAAIHPGVTYLSTWKLLASPTGAYTQYLGVSGGSLVEIRDDDGIHLAPPAGDDLVARAVIHVVAAKLGVALAPGFAVTPPAPHRAPPLSPRHFVPPI